MCSHAWRLSAPLTVKISAGGDCGRAEIPRETLEWIAFGLAETLVCEALKKPIDCRGLYMVVRPIHQPLSGFRYGCEFGGVITRYGIRRVSAEGGQIKHESPRSWFVTVWGAMLSPVRGEARAPRQ
jgi:hypothetical protein